MSLVESNIYGKIFFLPLLNKHHAIPLLARTTPSANIPSRKYVKEEWSEILSQQMQPAIKPQNSIAGKNKTKNKTDPALFLAPPPSLKVDKIP